MDFSVLLEGLDGLGDLFALDAELLGDVAGAYGLADLLHGLEDCFRTCAPSLHLNIRYRTICSKGHLSFRRKRRENVVIRCAWLNSTSRISIFGI